MAKRKDIKGKKFNLLTVLEFSHVKNGKAYWKCICDCGVIKSYIGVNLSNGHTKSCGCKKGNIKHLMIKTPEYKSWQHIKDRCLNQNSKRYCDYGGRGITMHNEWVGSFELYYNYIGKRPSKKHSIDRIDNDGNYEPGNIRWATHTQQANNTRVNRIINYKGISKTASEWATSLNIKPSTLLARLYRGWDAKRTIETPLLNV